MKRITRFLVDPPIGWFVALEGFILLLAVTAFFDGDTLAGGTLVVLVVLSVGWRIRDHSARGDTRRGGSS